MCWLSLRGADHKMEIKYRGLIRIMPMKGHGEGAGSWGQPLDNDRSDTCERTGARQENQVGRNYGAALRKARLTQWGAVS